jgi:6,7-dimethyl-8-ribityllumazine synthase
LRTENSRKHDLSYFTDKLKVCIVSAPYYRDITENLIRGALNVLKKIKADTEIVEVSGALEIPTAIKLMENEFDGFIAVGCIIRGETTHYEIVSTESSRGLTNLGLEKICIGNAILTVENKLQAEKRADPKIFDKGGEACNALLSIIKVKGRGN